MRLHRQEIRVDEARDPFIRVRLGIQPSATVSSRSRTEIQQNRAAQVLRLGERRVDVFTPLHRHTSIVSLKNDGPDRPG